MASLSGSKGLSLLGVLVAIALLIAGSLAVAQLLSRGRAAAGSARETFVATNLAREGLELTRSVRDTNWLKDLEPAQERDYANLLCGTDTTNTFTIEPDELFPDGYVINDSASGDDFKLFLNDQEQYTHAASGNVESIFRREITIDCSQMETNNSDDEAALIEVSAKVTWNTRGRDHNVELKTKLYDWYGGGVNYLALPQPIFQPCPEAPEPIQLPFGPVPEPVNTQVCSERYSYSLPLAQPTKVSLIFDVGELGFHPEDSAIGNCSPVKMTAYINDELVTPNADFLGWYKPNAGSFKNNPKTVELLDGRELPAGTTTIQLQGEGFAEGCNNGSLPSWAGLVTPIAL